MPLYIPQDKQTRSISEQGKLAKQQFLKLFQHMAQDPECAISGIVDFWSARQKYLLPYGGIIACGLDQNWEWITFPLSLINIDSSQSHTAQFTQSLYVNFLSNLPHSPVRCLYALTMQQP